MKTSPAMLGIGKFLWVLFLIPDLCIWSICGEEPCKVQLYVKRSSVHHVLAGDSFELKCPVKYCGHRPNVTWCKLNGTNYLPLVDRPQIHMSWKEGENISDFILHFESVHPSDNGSYRCSANSTSHVIHSHSTAIYVTDTKSASRPPSKKEMADSPWLLYGLLASGGLPLLLITCFCLLCCLRGHPGKQKKPFDAAGREINLVNMPQLIRGEQADVGTRKNSQTLPPETGIYDNDPWFKMQEGSEVYSNSGLEETKQGIVYASLNHAIIGMNPRQAKNEKEEPTEYASICVRS
ncbi:B- and T-lymphocyte attenuator isoform X1 [Lepus europaeus]|uniref:B- and T-lymphocyte attenuator isoform X1 n=1 Tax=Lepus europaeus TaxID=9983 RepID=UPI002B48AD79|nr:B- and T-lymphocyte attenuator isoform X1 [Lepus europaeus]